MNFKKAVIVAAGLSSRLYPLTLDRPKGLLPLGNTTLLQHSIEAIKNCGISDVAIVVGYKDQMIRESLGNQVTYIYNPFYEKCNNLGSCWMAKDFIGSAPVIYMHGDLAYDSEILRSALKENQSSSDLELITDFKVCNEEEMKVRVDERHYLIESSKEIPLHLAQGEWTGIALVNNSERMLNAFEETLRQKELNRYDTFAFNQMVQDGAKIRCSSTENRKWLEIDFADDYERAKTLFT